MKYHLIFLGLFLVRLSTLAQVPFEALEYHLTKDSLLKPVISGPASVCLGMTQFYLAENCFEKEKTEWKVLGNAAKIRSIYTDHRLELQFVRTGQVQLVLQRESTWGKGNDTLDVEVRPGPSLDFGKDTTLCPGDSLILNIDPSISEYKWSDGFSGSQRIIREKGLYRVLAKNDLGCKSIASLAVEVARKPDIDLGVEKVTCEGNSPRLRAGSGYFSYLWQDGSTGATMVAKDPGTYWVMVTNHCEMAGGDTVEVTAAEIEEVKLGEDRFFCSQDSITLDAGQGFTRYEWQDGSYQRFYPVFESGIYWVDVVDEKGCKIRGTVRLEVESCESPLRIPKAFSPNDDGVNDVFKPVAMEGVRSFGMQIMNANGLIMYFSANVNAGWDGNFDKKPASEGIYSYSLQYKDPTGKRQFEAGNFELKR